ncbi:MAG: uroporphyrinogen-III synthase [Bacteroidales bacterium]|nr:uroporphyrinogen-III synthase [Candidatus Cryptobacteroides caccocaballi]
MKRILISQPAPQVASPFPALAEKYGVTIDFKPFFHIEPLSSREFRTQKINLADYTAIVFSSKSTIDAYFHMCEELRVKVPETMKYFCSTENVAKYLQKHIVYRKRKIFFGQGPADTILSEIGTKHNGEKFLVTTSETPVNDVTKAFEKAGLDFTPAVFVKPVSQDIKDIDIDSYDIIAVYNAADVRSLYENYPEYKQGKTKFITFGKSIVKAMEEAGLEIAIAAPTVEVPSVLKAVEILITQD